MKITLRSKVYDSENVELYPVIGLKITCGRWRWLINPPILQSQLINQSQDSIPLWMLFYRSVEISTDGITFLHLSEIFY